MSQPEADQSSTDAEARRRREEDATAQSVRDAEKVLADAKKARENKEKAKIATQAEAARVAADLRYRKQQVSELRKALENGNLAICVGSGVSLFSTATADAERSSLPSITWRGLIRDGIDYLIRDQNLDRSDLETDLQRAIEDLGKLPADTRTKDVIGAATTMRSYMAKYDGLFASWLREVFGNLSDEVRHPEILNVLAKLQKKRAMIFTTNYDGLLEHCTGLPAVDISMQEDLGAYERKEQDAIFHPHGYYRRTKEIVLDAFNYYDTTRNDRLQDILRRFLQTKTILFVGCGSGLEDPNIGPLMSWIGKQEKDVARRHYIMLYEKDSPVLGPLNKIYYGGKHHDQVAPWLEQLLGDGTIVGEGTMSDIPTDSERRRIHDWLAPVDQRKTHSQLMDIHAQDTGLWFLRGPEFFDWLQQKHQTSFLWLHGPDGCGKSVLCSNIINTIQEACRPSEPTRTRDTLAYFYCTVADGQGSDEAPAQLLDFRHFLCSAISQFCPPRGSFESLSKLYRACVGVYPERQPTSLELQEVCMSILRTLSTARHAAGILWDGAGRPTDIIQPGEVFLVIDGLDRRPPTDRDKYQKFLTKVESLGLSNLHILITSRGDPGIRKSFMALKSCTLLAIDPTDITADIQTYLSNIIEESVQLSAEPSHVKKDIESRVLAQCKSRWFRDATLKMEALQRLETTDAREILECLGLAPESQPPEDPPSEEQTSTDRRIPAEETLSQNQGKQEPEDWFQNYEQFLDDWIFPLIETRSRTITSRVAILGTGVDLSDPFIQGCADQIKDVKSWVDRGSNITDTSGHGTHLTALLLRVAPVSDIFIAQICPSIPDDENYVENIIKAIDMAIKWKVQIIVIPFALSMIDYKLEQVIRVAQHANILVLCAAPLYRGQQHLSREQLYSTSITIRSTNAFGYSSTFSPPADPYSDNFATLGEDVESSWPQALLQAEHQSYTKTWSDTGIATVLVAGIAANLFFYADHNMGGRSNLEDKINMLRLCGVRQGHGLTYLAPWLLFRPGNKDDEVIARLFDTISRARQM